MPALKEEHSSKSKNAPGERYEYYQNGPWCNDRERSDMYDLVIVGSGPAGLSAAIYAKRSNLNVVVIEKEYLGTGQIAESSRVDNYPGYFGISGYDLGEKLREHAEELNTIFENESVIKIENAVESTTKKKYFRIHGESGIIYESVSVIFAAGASPRKGNIYGEEFFAGKGVSYCALCDGAFYKGKTVAVLGGGDTALDDALFLSDVCEKVYLIHRRKEFRGSQATVLKVEERGNIEICLADEVVSILGNNNVEKIVMKSGKNIGVDGVFIAFGSVPNSKMISDLVTTDENGYVIASEDGRTNLEGFFVAGDIRTKEVRQVVTAVSDGANAATSSYKYISNVK